MDATASAVQPRRNEAIDVLRGLVMVVMLLDHARLFWGGFTPDPTNLATTTVPLFFTRWVTHFCAPVFVFLAGTAAYLYGRRNGPRMLTRFLWTRGLWLIFLELMVLKWAWAPEPGYSVVFLQVIWAIGWSMIALAALSRLPLALTAAIGMAIVCGHNLLDPVQPQDLGSASWLWTILHVQMPIRISDGLTFINLYPLLAWFGVISLGYVFGTVMTLPPGERRRVALRLGAAMILAFIVLRSFDLYGDAAKWAAQPSHAFTLLSFLNCTKYPPSLLFLLMTLGPALCLLAWFEARPRGWLRNVLLTFGRVPLFFYAAHLFLIRFSALPVSVARFGDRAFSLPPDPAGSAMIGLGAAYIAWALALVVLYPACRWFARIKQERRDWWLSYL